MDIISEVNGFSERIRALFRKAMSIESDFDSKAFEPTIEFTYHVDSVGTGFWHCEIYSHVVDYSGGHTRHHSFTAKTIGLLIRYVEDAIYKQEKFYGIK